MGKLPLSVAIITYNEEDIIGRTIESVKDIAKEIIVVDSHSTDRTREIARDLGAKVFEEDWKGYSAQKNSALEKCTQEWVLFIDADEVVSEELKESIIKELSFPTADGYMINRRTYYLGDFLRYAWQPEWRLRLVRKSANPRWVGDTHEKLLIDSVNIKKLKGDLLHFTYKSLKHQMIKTVEFAFYAAEGKSNTQVKFFRDIVLRPIWAFFRTFILKKGLLDGKKGFIIAASACMYTFMKYSFLYEKNLKGTFGEKLWQRK